MRLPIRLVTVASLALAPALARAEHPHVEVVKRYREASRRGDAEALRRILSEDSRIWFGERSGPGRPRDVSGRGPWAGWDDVFRSDVRTLEHHVEGESVRTVVTEINDWDLLVERPARRYQVTYWIDGEDRIEGMLVHPLPGAPKAPDRLADFEAWARERHPGLLDRLMPGGDIDPERATDWRNALRQWREESGLFDPISGSAPSREIVPRPFTACEIREGMPAGTRIRFRVEKDGGTPILLEWRVLEADDASMTLRSQVLDEEGLPVGEPTTAQHEWTALRDHATSEAASTTVRDSSVEVPAGPFPTRLHETRREEGGETVVERSHFVRALPGPPVSRTVERDGRVVHAMTLVSRTAD